MALSETTVGVLIGAGATVGGSLVTLVTGLLAFLVDSRRRRWEEDRRWDDARRRASVDFIAASRMAITRAARAANMRYALLVHRAQRPGVPDADLDRRIEELAATVQEDQENFDAWSGRLNDASAEIYLIATRPTREAAEAHIKVIEELLDIVGWGDTSADDLLPRLLGASTRYEEAKEAFRRAAMAELRVERRRWWQVGRKRERAYDKRAPS